MSVIMTVDVTAWLPLRRWLGDRFQLVREEASWVGFRIPEHDAWVKVVLDGGNTVIVLAPACEAVQLDVPQPERLLGEALVTPTLVGADGMWLVRETCALGDATTERLNRMIAFVATQAAAVRQAVTRVRALAFCNANFAE